MKKRRSVIKSLKLRSKSYANPNLNPNYRQSDTPLKTIIIPVQSEEQLKCPLSKETQPQ